MVSAPDYRRIFESVSGLYLILAPDFTIVAVSDAYLRATMTERDKIIGHNLFEIFPDNPDDPGATGTSNLRASLERVLRTRNSDTMAVQKYDVRRPEREGGGFTVRHWSPANSPVLNEKGELLYIVHQVEDVTGFVQLNELKTRTTHMEAEIYRRAQELQRVNELLRVANQEYDQFFSMSLDLLCISGYDGYFKKVNPAFESVLGFTPEEMCKTTYLEFIHPDDVERTKLEVEKQLKRREPVLNFENRYRCKDGTYRLLQWKSAPTGSMMYAAARDITESRRAEQELRQAKEAADLSNRELESFSYSVAHDLRAPLHSMTGFSQLLLEDYGQLMPQEARACVLRMAEATRRMKMLVDGLLDLSAVTRKEIVKQPIDLTALAYEVATEIQSSEPARSATFVISDTMKTEGDPVLIKAALTNLIGNAWKYTRNVGARARIEVGWTEKEGKRAYFVKDNGAGFDMNFAGKLFGVFQRFHSPQEFEGTGIGLATVHRIVTRHGGEIWADAAPGRGATFYFTV